MPRQTRLYLVRYDGTTGNYPSNHNGNRAKGIEKLKNILRGKEAGEWAIAYIYDAQTPTGTPPLFAFHPSEGVREITKERAEQLRAKANQGVNAYKYRAYCIPRIEEQVQGAAPYPIKVRTVQQAVQELRAKDLEKIILYDKANNPVQTITNQ